MSARARNCRFSNPVACCDSTFAVTTPERRLIRHALIQINNLPLFPHLMGLSFLSFIHYRLPDSNCRKGNNPMVARTLGRLIASVSPHSDDYFNLFNELTACTVRGAKLLAKLSLAQDPVAFDLLFADIQKAEGEADGVTRNIFMSLHKSFITPFDRWEIKDLAKALDDMIDCMEDIPQRAKLY